MRVPKDLACGVCGGYGGVRNMDEQSNILTCYYCSGRGVDPIPYVELINGNVRNPG